MTLHADEDERVAFFYRFSLTGSEVLKISFIIRLKQTADDLIFQDRVVLMKASYSAKICTVERAPKETYLRSPEKKHQKAFLFRFFIDNTKQKYCPELNKLIKSKQNNCNQLKIFKECNSSIVLHSSFLVIVVFKRLYSSSHVDTHNRWESSGPHFFGIDPNILHSTLFTIPLIPLILPCLSTT